jgi:hypothetical protein
VDISWSGASDALSGIAGYYYKWDHSPSTIPSTSDSFTSGTSAISSPLPDASDWYFHVRAKDNAGNLASGTYHAGPFKIDTALPEGSIIINGGDAWTNSNAVTLSLIYTDVLSGVDKVRYSNDGVWDSEPWEDPAPSKSWILDGADGTKTVSYQIRDNVGNTYTTSDDIIWDTTEPSAPVISSSTHPDENNWYNNSNPSFTWTTPSDSSEIAGYSYELDHLGTSTPDTTIDTPENSKSYTNVADGEWWFHIRARDNAGNWGAVAHYRVKIGSPFNLWVVVGGIVGGLAVVSIATYLLRKRRGKMV